MTEVLENAPATLAAARRLLVERHALLTRVTHWINLLCIVVLLMSGLQIFNAHPILYLGEFGVTCGDLIGTVAVPPGISR
jgi:hypothetical protein